MPDNGARGRAVASRQPVCPVCHNLDRDHISVLNPKLPFPMLTTELKHLARAGKKGCQICYAIKAGVLLMMGLDPNKQNYRFAVCIVRLELSQIVRAEALGVYLSPQGTACSDQVTFDLFTKPENPSPWPAFGPARDVTPTLHSRRRQRMMREWIDKCTTSHPTCRANLGHGVQGSAPKRYLDLGKNPRNGVKLVDTWASPGSYVAIIHGVAGPLPAPSSFTTAENLEERQRRMEWWQIPVALQEALTVANEQGVRYAWISDFCLLHGDAEDYNWHLDREDAIFRFAHFTIALTDTTDLRLSNFRPVRKAAADEDADEVADQRAGSRTIEISHQGRTYPIQVRPSMHMTHWIMAERAFLKLMTRKPHSIAVSRHKMGLLRHAPSLQRILLSPRVLHLHRSEMVWDCLQGWACECGDDYQFKTHEDFSQPLPREEFYTKGCTHGGDPSYLLQLYMKRSLPQHDQRLAHMAGMLRHMSRVTGKRYCAAVAASSPEELAEELLWNISLPQNETESLLPGETSHRHHTPHIPTWSWVSMVLGAFRCIQTAELMLPDMTLGPLSTSPSFRFWDLRYKTAPGSSGDGLLASEYQLEVSANVVRGRVSALPEQGNGMHNVTQLLFTPETAPGGTPPKGPISFRADCDELVASVKSSQSPADFYFMWLGKMAIEYSGPEPPPIDGCDSSRGDVGLVLRAAQQSYAVGFERVGVFAIPAGFYNFADCSVLRLVLV
ncbi:hypothetical protein LX36DRAFT_658300 [Colletotrichum falcatum]|nr:hypothetical protein LX36DRAFT_658300 [Colletotrichum falcatum]